jgi:gas vesicle protein
MERDTWLCFLIGLGSGIAIGMLFAPQPGAQIREGIKQKADEGAGYVKRRGTDLKDGAAEVIEKGKRAIGLAHEQVAEPLGAGRQG